MRDPMIDDPEATAHARVLRLAGHLVELGEAALELADDFAADGAGADELVWHWLRNAGAELRLLAGRLAVGLYHEESDLFQQVKEVARRVKERDAAEAPPGPEPSCTEWSEP